MAIDYRRSQRKEPLMSTRRHHQPREPVNAPVKADAQGRIKVALTAAATITAALITAGAMLLAPGGNQSGNNHVQGGDGTNCNYWGNHGVLNCVAPSKTPESGNDRATSDPPSGPLRGRFTSMTLWSTEPILVLPSGLAMFSHADAPSEIATFSVTREMAHPFMPSVSLTATSTVETHPLPGLKLPGPTARAGTPTSTPAHPKTPTLGGF